MDASAEGLHLIVGRDDIEHIVLIGHQAAQATRTELGHKDELWHNRFVRKVDFLDKRLSCSHFHLIHLAVVVDEQITFIIFFAGIGIAIKFVDGECKALLQKRIGEEFALLGFHLAGVHIDELNAILCETESIVGILQIHSLGKGFEQEPKATIGAIGVRVIGATMIVYVGLTNELRRHRIAANCVGQTSRIHKLRSPEERQQRVSFLHRIFAPGDAATALSFGILNEFVGQSTVERERLSSKLIAMQETYRIIVVEPGQFPDDKQDDDNAEYDISKFSHHSIPFLKRSILIQGSRMHAKTNTMRQGRNGT